MVAGQHQDSQNVAVLHQPTQTPGNSNFLPKFLPRKTAIPNFAVIFAGEELRSEIFTAVGL
jgi:hypothetical protein